MFVRCKHWSEKLITDGKETPEDRRVRQREQRKRSRAVCTSVSQLLLVKAWSALPWLW